MRLYYYEAYKPDVRGSFTMKGHVMANTINMAYGMACRALDIDPEDERAWVDVKNVNPCIGRFNKFGAVYRSAIKFTPKNTLDETEKLDKRRAQEFLDEI